ncbi:mammalian cell entry protein [Mycobacterium sp. NPDC051804]|uniref:mammalian cell entry protein n=1 Tax=Mycobacterium sp. NPDC051804 TaxID=3364295 RepID=UPI0037920133
MEDQPADPGDLTTEAEAPATSAPSRRRRFSLRRRPKTAEPETVTEPDAESIEPVESVETDEAPRTPVGKKRRAPKAEEPAEDVALVDPPKSVDPAEPEADPSEAEDEPIDEPEDDRVLVPHQAAGKRLLVAAAAAAVLFVGAAAFAGAAVQPYLAERATVDTKIDVARTAASAISTLWSYTPENMEALPDRAEVFLGGDFANEYRKYIDAIVAPNKQAQVTNTTQVMGAAVESLSADEATAIVYTNSVATSPVTKNIPSLRYLSYRLTMERDHAKWLITKMSTVTSFDLTPQL